MNGSKFNVLLYSDESQYSFFALVYAAIFMMNMPNMHLTIVQLKESNDCFRPTSDWIKDFIDRTNSDAKTGYHEMLTRINEIFCMRTNDIHHQVIYCNPNIPDTVEALLEYARKRSIELFIMGTGELRSLKGYIFGNLAHTLQIRSPIPVLFVKKIPEDLLESYRKKPTLKLIWKET